MEGVEAATNKVKAKLRAAKNYNDLNDLADVSSRMGTQRVAEMLGRGMFLAELLGRYQVQKELEK